MGQPPRAKSRVEKELERKIAVKDNQPDVSAAAFFFHVVIIIIPIYFLSIQELEL